MIKRTLLLIALISYASPLFAQTFEKVGDTLIAPFANDAKRRIAVLDFETDSPGLKTTASIFRDRLTTYLVQTGRVEVIERTLLKKIIDEHKLNVSGIIDEQTGEKLGKFLGAYAVVTGSVFSIDKKRAELNARLIRVENASILSAANMIATLNNDATEIVATELKRADYAGEPWIQIALLLDTSNSMDGLIHQAKTQLWKIVNKMAKAERDGKNPKIEIALYEYGNDSLEESDSYIRRVTPFTTDLDDVSGKLFALKTNGGSEYAGAVIRHAVKNLKWRGEKGVYKAIFIAGNEGFDQGPVDPNEAVADAKGNNIFVNTIFCGPKQEGMATGWSDGATAGRGLFLNIDQEERVVAVQAPQDDEIVRLGRSINNTNIPYGEAGAQKAAAQSAADEMAESEAASGANVQRSLFKSKLQYQESMTWDIVTGVEEGRVKIKDIDKKKLPADLQKLNDKQLEAAINKKIAERKEIRKKIEKLEKERDSYITKEESKRAGASPSKSLDRAMEQAVEIQGSGVDYNFK